MKRYEILSFALAFTLSLAALSQVPAEKKLKVALVLPDTINDLSWNQGAYEGLLAAQKKLKFEMVYQERVADADVERVVRDYAKKGFDLILAESFNYGDAILKVAKDFPKVKFATATHFKTAPNAAIYDWPAHHAGYLAGMLAAMMSKKGIIGFVGGYEVPDIIRIAEGYKLGAKVVNPNIKVKGVYTGSWVDVVKGREAAIALLDAGADVIAQGADGPGIGAIKAAQERGAYAIGYVADQNRVAPKTVLTSIVLNKGVAYAKMIDDLKKGTFKGKEYLFDMTQGGVVLSPLYNVPKDIADKIDEARKDIMAGKLKVPDRTRSTKWD